MAHKTYHPARNCWNRVLVFILLNSLIWWVAFSVSRHYLDGADMVENYAWGINWQWGTNKHPPLFGWITAAWFTLFPTTDWAYYLLNELNLGVAFVFLALAMRRVLLPQQVCVALALTALASCFGADSGYKYNADTGQLPFIAGFLWTVLVAVQERRTRYFLLAGVFAGAAVLVKYYALILLLAVGLGIWLALRPSFRDLAMGGLYAGVVCLAVVSPHLIWAQQHGWPTLHYMHAAHVVQAPKEGLHALFEALVRVFLFGAAALVTWRVIFIRLPGATPVRPEGHAPRLGLIIFSLSLMLTLLGSWMEDLLPTAPWFIPAFLFLGWALVDATPATTNWTRYVQRMQGATFVWWAMVLTGAVAYGAQYRTYPVPPAYALPKRVAEDVTRLYHQTYHHPIRYAAGRFPYPYELSFYSPDHPLGLAGLSISDSPWIEREALKRDAKVVVCGTEQIDGPQDGSCDQEARHVLGAPDRTVMLSYPVYDPRHRRLDIQHYRIMMYAPDKPNEHATRVAQS